MTSVDPVEDAPLTDEHCGFCTLHYAIHPRYKTPESLARAVSKNADAHEWLPPSTYAAVRAAILASDPRVQALEAVARAARQMAREFDFEFRTDPSRMAVEAALAALQEVPGRGEDGDGNVRV